MRRRPAGARRSKQIVLSNIFTYFNMLFFLLALCVIAVQQWLNLTFMGVIIVNTAIGIVQELRSKKTLDKLSILASPKAVAVRDGKRVTVDTAQLVRDDIVVFAARQPDLCRRRGRAGQLLRQ